MNVFKYKNVKAIQKNFSFRKANSVRRKAFQRNSSVSKYTHIHTVHTVYTKGMPGQKLKTLFPFRK